jgi:PBP1b-binding outer membrane lipoprotein LpoB
MKTKVLAILAIALAFAGCTQVHEVQDNVKNAPEDFWTSVRTILSFLLDTVIGVLGSWVRGLLGV